MENEPIFKIHLIRILTKKQLIFVIHFNDKDGLKKWRVENEPIFKIDLLRILTEKQLISVIHFNGKDGLKK